MISTLWKTMKWLMLLVLLLVAGGGVAAVYFWNYSDDLLRTALLDHIHAWAPGSKAQIKRCRIDLLGQVHLDDFSLVLPGESTPFLVLPEATIDLDRDAFLERSDVVVQNIKLDRPQLQLSRVANGQWNFQKLPPLPRGKKGALPACRIEKAQLKLAIAQADGQTVGNVQVTRADVALKPTSKRTFELSGSADMEHVGHVSLDGKLNIDSLTGDLKGSLAGLRVDRELLQYAATFEPRAGSAVAQLESKLRAEFLKEPDLTAASPYAIQGIARKDRRGPVVQPASGSNATATKSVKVERDVSPKSRGEQVAFAHSVQAEQVGATNSILGLSAMLNVSFQIDRQQADVVPNVRLVCDIVGGDITNTALAFPLSELTGQVEISRDRMTIRRLGATNGPTEVVLRGEVLWAEAGPQGRVGVKLSNLTCDQRLRDRLSIGFGRLYDALHPRGTLDLEAVVETTAEGQWKPESLTVTANKCAVAHDVFPYPIEDAIGTIKLSGKDVLLDLRGYAGRQPVTLKGQVKDPGPKAWIVLDIDVANLPIDEQFVKACPPPLQKTINAMKLKGVVDAKWRLEKPPGEGRLFKPDLVGFLHDGSMTYEPFPYRIDALTGKLEFDGTTWKFSDLKGLHGGAELAANGSFYKPKGQIGRLDLTVDAKDAPIDSSLFDAVPKSIKKLWQDFEPRGSIKHLVTKVEWDEGTPPIVRLPVIEITRGRCMMPCFPYELTDIEASYDYIPGHFNQEQNRRVPTLLKVKSFEGRHNKALLVVNRNGGFVTIDENGDWRLRLENWHARDLRPDQDLLRAVSSGLRSVLGTFEPDRGLDVAGLLELRGAADPRLPLTAAWAIDTELTGSSVAAGLAFNDVQGKIQSRGVWNGHEAEVDGQLDLESVKVFEKFELNDVRGPFTLRKGLLTFGTDKALDDIATDETLSPKDQITARFLQGVLTLNGQVAVDASSAYQVRVSLAQGQLETFARKYMQQGEKVRGTMHGWMKLEGDGTDPRQLVGTGQLQISPAALYELPIVFHVLDVLLPAASKVSAFNYALCNFKVAKGRFLFDAIDLVGDQVQMRGTGNASFDGDIDLVFYSMLPYSMLPKSPFPFWVPVVSEVSSLVSKVTREATKGWVVVKVTGKTSDPETKVVPAANLDEAVKGFLNTLGPLPITPQPLRPLAPIGQADERRVRR